jgi:hypothetical protein
MEFLFNDPTILRQAPVDTRLLDLNATPNPDGKHLRVSLELSPFQQRPDIEINLTDFVGNLVASASIVDQSVGNSN